MLSDIDAVFKGRIEELARTAASRDCFTFSDFLTMAERSYVLECARSLPASVTFSGGFENAERVIARFGPAEDIGHEARFPIVILHISPLNAKFSDKLTHRDLLGALMNLGIERKLTGDILTNGTDAYVFVSERIAPFITESLTRVKHTSVTVQPADALPEGMIRDPEQFSVVVPSLRLDAVIAKVYSLSRKEVQALLSGEKVFVNSISTTRASYLLKENDLVSVRGSGRFRFCTCEGDTRKGNLRILIEK